MKLRIFIGSSSEAKAIAIQLSEEIEKSINAEVTCWFDEGVFEVNTSTLSSLLNGRLLYDYALLLATRDDLTTSRKKQNSTPRDNVIFEFGLFLGALGENRTLLLQENGAKIPTDLNGITVPRFNLIPDSIGELSKNIVQHIKNNEGLNEYSVLPSTALAVGYYYSFIKTVTHSINEVADSLDLKDDSCESVEVKIVIPSKLSVDIGQKAKTLYEENSFKDGFIKSGKRPFPIKYVFDKVNTKHAIIYDMPTTLNTIRPTCEKLLKKSSVGITANQSIVEERELNNFKSTLESLTNEDDYCKNLKIIWENEL